MDYLKWAESYREQATVISNKIEEFRAKRKQAKTPEQKYELDNLIQKYEEIHYDLITTYRDLKERGENILHKENKNGNTQQFNV